MSLEDIEHELQKLKNPEKARLLQGFFKTGKGEYGEGDFFLADFLLRRLSLFHLHPFPCLIFRSPKKF